MCCSHTQHIVNSIIAVVAWSYILTTDQSLVFHVVPHFILHAMHWAIVCSFRTTEEYLGGNCPREIAVKLMCVCVSVCWDNVDSGAPFCVTAGRELAVLRVSMAGFSLSDIHWQTGKLKRVLQQRFAAYDWRPNDVTTTVVCLQIRTHV